MGVFDDHFIFMEDWTNPLLEALSVMDDTESIFADHMYQNQAIVDWDGASNSNALAEAKVSNHGGLRDRIAAKGNFKHLSLNTENLSKDPAEITLTIPPGLSPTYLLDSPVFLPNSIPSPTTGKLPVAPNENNQNSALPVDDFDKGKENTFQDANASSFAYKPVAESSSCPYFHAENKVNPPSFAPQPFSSNDMNIADNSLLHQSIEPSNTCLQYNGELFHQDTYTNDANNFSMEQTYNVFGAQEPPPLNDKEVDGGKRRSSEDSYVVDGRHEEDGYNWKKYGQKPVKGSDYPRSYFKCMHRNCPVKKKVVRAVEGHITEIIYKGVHNHPKPPSNHLHILNSSNPLGETQLEQSNYTNILNSSNPLDETQLEQSNADGEVDWSQWLECFEENTSSTLQDLSGFKYEPLDQASALLNDDHVTHGSASLGCDGEEEESESKRRRTETYGSDRVGAGRASKEPRIVVQTTSDVDLIDDGYRWRKYGQKIVKGNPNPRSYYKCTSPNCNVRRHVERASHNRRSIITTYEGIHNHEIPPPRNINNHINPGGSMPYLAQQAPNPFHIGRIERNPLKGPYRPRHGSGPGYGYGMTQQTRLTGQGRGGLGHRYTGEQQAFMAPKMQPVAENSAKWSHMQPGPQM